MTDRTPDGPPDRPTAETPWPVSMLSAKLKGWIDRLGAVWVEGELTQWGLRGGNVFAKLKDLDTDASISINLWSSTVAKLSEKFAPGDHVVALVKPDYWVKAGTLSMVVFELRHVGLGDLLERLERLRRQLADEGLFARERKVPLPFLPARIGLITGKDSDAEKDVLKNAQLRWPSVEFRVRHAVVQGDRAVSDISNAIRELDADPTVDVIIVARGGGDFQTLLVFSDEKLLRTAAACVTPLVSAIGHENDHPLLDDIADLRASTPTDAAKRVVPDVAEELAGVRQARSRIGTRVSTIIRHEIERIGHLRSRPALADPSTLIDRRSEELTRWIAQGSHHIDLVVERADNQIETLVGHLRALSPRRTLERGYAIAQLPDGTALRSAADAGVGTRLLVTVADGAVSTTVEAAEPGISSRD